MNFNKKIALLFALLAATATVFSQNSSKSKSKTKLYEKGENQVRVRNVNTVNSPNTDYSPTFYKNGLVYVSSRARTGARDRATGETFFDLYFAPFDPSGQPARPENFSLNINSQLHEGPVTFSRDGKTIYFTRNNMEKGVPKAGRDGKIHMKIYEAQRTKTDWAHVRELPFNSANYSCKHPSLSADGRFLYFSSDMPGGQGGHDLYVCERVGTGWSEAKNLGPDINTSKNEGFPFIHAGGNLFFTSDGHNSLGGLDNFSAKRVGDEVVEIINLGEPFNTSGDDFGIIWNDDLDEGYFSSERAGGLGKDDIYFFAVDAPFKEASPRLVSELAQIRAVDAADGVPLQKAEVRIFKPTTDGFITGKDSSKSDFYNIDLEPKSADGNVLTLNLTRKNAATLGEPELFTNASGEAKYLFDPYRTYLVVVSMDGYRTAEQLLVFEPGQKPPPLDLRLERTEPCVFANGTVATQDFGWRLDNAKCFFTHKKSGRQTQCSTDLNGSFQVCLPGEGEYFVQIEKPGQDPKEENISISRQKDLFLEFRTIPSKISGNDPALPPPSTLKEGSIIVLDKIVFEENSANLIANAPRYLDALAVLMGRYPEMEIDLLVHTDSRGEASTNRRVSQEYANNARAYLAWRKIAENRVVAIGKGESEIRNDCTEGVNCTEEEHLQNRRLEIRIRKLGIQTQPK